MSGALRVVVDKDSCQSSGSCIDVLPEAFGWDDDDLGEVLPGAAVASRERILDAARRCPALAIAVFDADGKDLSSGD